MRFRAAVLFITSTFLLGGCVSNTDKSSDNGDGDGDGDETTPVRLDDPDHGASGPWIEAEDQQWVDFCETITQHAVALQEDCCGLPLPSDINATKIVDLCVSTRVGEATILYNEDEANAYIERLQEAVDQCVQPPINTVGQGTLEAGDSCALEPSGEDLTPLAACGPGLICDIADREVCVKGIAEVGSDCSDAPCDFNLGLVCGDDSRCEQFLPGFGSELICE